MVNAPRSPAARAEIKTARRRCKMVSKEVFWKALSPEQKEMFWKNMNKCEEMGHEIEIVDARDIWEMLPKGEQAKFKKPE